MTQHQELSSGCVLPLVIAGAVLVAFTTPLNLVLLFFCWSLIGVTAGFYAADNSGLWLYLLCGVANVGLFLTLCGLAGWVFRRASLSKRRLAIVFVLVLHLGLWLGWSLAAVVRAAATDNWP